LRHSSFCFLCLWHLSKKKKGFHLVNVSNHINSIYKKKRLDEKQLIVNHMQTASKSIETSYPVYWGWDRTILNWGLFSYHLLEILIGGSILPQKYNFLWTISKTPRNDLKLHILSIRGEITPYIKFGFILIFFAWDFHSKFNYTRGLDT
jgi:hypothetical protein